MTGCVPPTAASAPPSDADALVVWLSDGEYLDWAAEREVTIGDNGAARRLFANETLIDGFSTEGAFAPGSAAVREMYTDDGELHGVSFMEKRDHAWFFLETFDLEGGTVAVAETEPAQCTFCHVDGRDLVQSDESFFDL